MGARFMALFDDKARLFIAGRRGIFDKIEIAEIAPHRPIWFHVSSLGEFEQARSLIESLHKAGEKILVTFFSPSGYEIRKNYKFADWIFYLPFDSKNNAEKFIRLTNPKTAVFVKYDLWYFYLKRLQKIQTPSYLISALYQSDQVYFKPWLGKLHRDMLSTFEHIYLQDEASKKLLQKINIEPSSVVGDTRVDSVIERSKNRIKLPIIEQFLGEQKAIIIGSAYVAEIEILAPLLSNWTEEKIIIAPHDISTSNIESIRKTLAKKSDLYSNLKDGANSSNHILILDNIGLLFNCYSYGKWAFIGGGYGKGLHNTLEPAAFGLPVCFGPKYQKFSEAVSMVKTGAAFVIESTSDLKKLSSQLENKEAQNDVSDKVNKYMQLSQGATPNILKAILQKIR